MITLDEARQKAVAWCAAWNARDLDAIMAHYADDVAFSSPTVVARWGHADGWLRGKAKLRENFAIGVKAPALRFELVDVLLGVDAMCVIYRRETGALVSDLVEFNAHGHGPACVRLLWAPGALTTSTTSTHLLPALITAAGERASLRFLEFFAGTIRNTHTRRAYGRAVAAFLAWCEEAGVPSIAAVQPLHVATWIELQTRERAAASVKQQLAAIRHLFDWLVTGQVVPVNPAASVRGPSHVVRQGKTPVLEPAEARALLDSIDVMTPAGLRDRALIALMVYSFARIGAALAMKVEDVFVQNRRLWVRLREKGGKAHAMPCHHNLESYLTAYLEQTGIMEDAKGSLFRTIGRGTSELTRTSLPQANAYAMIGRRAAAAGIATKVGNHSFRATGITAYLKNGGTLEKAAAMANHASTRTTQLYDRRQDEVSLDEVERIRL